jgi:hypothetical protein
MLVVQEKSIASSLSALLTILNAQPLSCSIDSLPDTTRCQARPDVAASESPASLLRDPPTAPFEKRRKANWEKRMEAIRRPLKDRSPLEAHPHRLRLAGEAHSAIGMRKRNSLL